MDSERYQPDPALVADLERKTAEAKARMGEKWLMHPANYAQRKTPPSQRLQLIEARVLVQRHRAAYPGLHSVCDSLLA